MKKAIIARKIGMTQIFVANGVVVPVTVLEAGPCVVVQKKTVVNDGYDALQLGFGEVRINPNNNKARVNRPAAGHYKKAGVEAKKVLKEFRLDDISGYEVGAEVKADVFVESDRVDISGVSKGKGYAGAIKRHGQHRGPMAHGSKYHRAVGSLSSATSPGKVKKGKAMPGHMGSENVTIQNLEVVKVDAERNLILVKGAVPGSRGSIVSLRDSVRV